MSYILLHFLFVISYSTLLLTSPRPFLLCQTLAFFSHRRWVFLNLCPRTYQSFMSVSTSFQTLLKFSCIFSSLSHQFPQNFLTNFIHFNLFVLPLFKDRRTVRLSVTKKPLIKSRPSLDFTINFT